MAVSDLITLKTHRNSNYSIISLAAVHDPRLSWQAKGLHTYLISRPPAWQVRRADLLRKALNGEKSLRGIIAELKLHGYLRMIRLRDKRGLWAGWEWEIFECEQKQENQALAPKGQKRHCRVTAMPERDTHSIKDCNNYDLKSSSSPPQTNEEEEININQLPAKFAALDPRTLARLERVCKAQGLDLAVQAKALCMEYSLARVEMRCPAGALMAKIKEGGIVRPAELVETAKEAEIKLKKERKRVRDAQELAEIPRWMR